MRTTLSIDDDLLAKAIALTGISERAALVRLALKSLVEREAARRLSLLGGTMPDFEPSPRRRSKPSEALEDRPADPMASESIPKAKL